MTFTLALSLFVAGLAGGFIAGLFGVGGGVLFAPVLFFSYQATGAPPEVVAPLTLGTSLCCTLVAALSSAWTHHRSGRVRLRIAGIVGLYSAAAVALTARLVTTQPWYDGRTFQIVFAMLLLAVVVQMVGEGGRDRPAEPLRLRPSVLAAIGLGAGSVASAAGVGGGIVMVPGFRQIVRMPMREAVGTSSAAIVVIAAAGVATYAATGWARPGLSDALGYATLGYVDLNRAAVLALPALATARLGASAAGRFRSRTLTLAFGALASGVALHLLIGALRG